MKAIKILCRDAEMQPNVDKNGVPFCADEHCCQYDGKRCRLVGFRPGNICEPAVKRMAARITAPDPITEALNSDNGVYRP